MITITCDHCAAAIPTERMNNRLQLVKWHEPDADPQTKALTPTYDLCDVCERSLVNVVIAWAQPVKVKETP